jgi:hypothetical protein
VQVYKPKVKVGHVAPGIPLKRVKERLAHVNGSIVEAPLVRWLYYILSFRFGFQDSIFEITGLFD